MSTGVYRVKYNSSDKNDLSTLKSKFEFVENTGGQVWALSEVGGELFVGHNKGAYIIRDKQAYPITSESWGYWRFQSLFPSSTNGPVVAGNYNGINIFYLQDGKMSDPKIMAKFESARFVVIYKNEIWVSAPI